MLTPQASHADAFCAALADMGVGAAAVTADGAWLAVNQRFCDIVELRPREVWATSIRDLLGTDTADFGGGTTAARTTDSKLQKKDLGAVWVRSSIAAVREPESGKVLFLLVIVADVTPQKAAERRGSDADHLTRGRREVSGRLINALEAERSRIARELHDDIGQSLAVLVVQMLRAGKPISGTPDRKHAEVPELARRLQEIAARVSQLSHELHSSRLEYLGLEKAVRGACNDFSKGERIAIECVCETVPAELDGAIGLCVLRVVQEALHNVAKHSRASRVKVTLTGSSGELAVTIEDDGAGFDVEEAAMAEGIGLISMRERVSFVGGTFDLSSTPGHGTRVKALVPLAVPASQP